MHSAQPLPFGGVGVGARFGPVPFTVSPAANERYWASAGVDHPRLRAGALYPPIAANLTILAFQTIAPGPLLHTRQRLLCHRRGEAGTELTVTGEVSERYEKRGREYVVVTARIALPDGEPLWTSIATFCQAGRSRSPQAEAEPESDRPGRSRSRQAEAKPESDRPGRSPS